MTVLCIGCTLDVLTNILIIISRKHKDLVKGIHGKSRDLHQGELGKES